MSHDYFYLIVNEAIPGKFINYLSSGMSKGMEYLMSPDNGERKGFTEGDFLRNASYLMCRRKYIENI